MGNERAMIVLRMRSYTQESPRPCPSSPDLRRGGTVLLAAGFSFGMFLVTYAAVGQPAPPAAAISCDDRVIGGIARKPTPPMVHVETLLDAPPGPLHLYRLAENPNILVLDFPDLAAQGRMLNRLAALVEKIAFPKDRVITEAALTEHFRQSGSSPSTFYFGHDYALNDIARFFNLLDRDALRPTDAERALRDLLVQAGALTHGSDGWVARPPPRALVSFTRPGLDLPSGALVTTDLRQTILRHELSHGEFFTNQRYRDYVKTFWSKKMTAVERDLVRRFLGENGYNPSDETLMANEMQAYLMHTPSVADTLPAMLGLPAHDLRRLSAAFAAGDPSWLAEVFPIAAEPRPVPVMD